MAAKRRKQPLTDVENKFGLTCLKEHILPSMLAHRSALTFVGGIASSSELSLTKINNRITCNYYANEKDCWKEINAFFKDIIDNHSHSGLSFKHGMDLHKHLLSLMKNVEYKKVRVNQPRAVKKMPALLPNPQYFPLFPRYVGSYSPRMVGCVAIINDLNFNLPLSFPRYFWQLLLHFPEYYRVVKYPINLDVINEKLSLKLYVDSNEFCSDFLLMISNSFEFYNQIGEIHMATMMMLAYFEYRYKMLPPE